MRYGEFDTASLMYITNRPDLVFERGEGAWLYDHNGKRYLDFIQGWAVNCLGHCPPEIRDALVKQASTLLNPSPAFYNGPMVELAGLLTANSVFDRVFFANTGAEANEGAIKLARKWGKVNKGGAYEIITFDHSFHGRTLATMSASGKPGWDTMYAPQVPGFPKADLNDIASVEALITDKTVAVMLEPVQGEGGVMPAAPGFLQAVRALCDRHDALMVLDEIQCGMGRSGALFAHWQDHVVPDIVTLAKALGGGMPIGALLAGPKVAQVMQFGAHGTTFGGNPLASAVARVALRKLGSDGIAANVGRQAQAIRDGLDAINRDLDLFAEVRGRGLMLGAVLKPACAGRAGEILDHAAANGLLLLQAGPDVLRFVPALNIGDEDVAEGLSRLRAALQAFSAG